jgi:hypothetical protein
VSARSAALAVAVAALAGGCAFTDGGPFAVLSAELAASAPIETDRALEDGWQKLASDYEVRIESLELELEPIALIEIAGGELGFDPANPPPGYSLCHNGHCHRDDGALVSYEEIAAELAGDSGAERVVVSLPVGALDLIAGERRPLDCAPSCELPLARIGLARLPLMRVRIAGQVRDGRGSPRLPGELDFAADYAPSGFAWLADLSLPADRGSDPDVDLSLELEVTSRSLDDIEFASLPAGGGVISMAEAEAAFLAGLGEIEMAATVTR